MLLPHTDTLSYKENSHRPTIASDIFVRWCWAAYLQSEDAKSRTFSKIDFSNVEEHKSVIEQSSKDYHDNVHRLFYPGIDLPTLNNHDEGPTIIVKTSSEDTLRDDGIELCKTLKALGAKVEHINHCGSHGISSTFDKKSNKKLLSIWEKVIWCQ